MATGLMRSGAGVELRMVSIGGRVHAGSDGGGACLCRDRPSELGFCFGQAVMHLATNLTIIPNPVPSRLHHETSSRNMLFWGKAPGSDRTQPDVLVDAGAILIVGLVSCSHASVRLPVLDSSDQHCVCCP